MNTHTIIYLFWCSFSYTSAHLKNRRIFFFFIVAKRNEEKQNISGKRKAAAAALISDHQLYPFQHKNTQSEIIQELKCKNAKNSSGQEAEQKQLRWAQSWWENREDVSYSLTGQLVQKNDFLMYLFVLCKHKMSDFQYIWFEESVKYICSKIRV